jgi:universal stress protein E
VGKLLVVADLQQKCFATPRGLELAHKLGLATEVVAFTYTALSRLNMDNAGQAEVKKQLMAEREASIQQRIDQYARPGQKVKLKVVWLKDIHPWIIKRASRGFEAVVKTTHRSESAGYTSTDWHLLRECAAPVLLVTDRKWSRTKPILAAVDLQAAARQKIQLNHAIVEHAVRYAQALDAELQIISALEIPRLLSELDLVDPLAYEKDQKAIMQPHLVKLAAAHNLPETLFRIKRGPIDKVISSEAARVRAQLVVMGTIGRKGIRARLIGNTAESVLRHLRTDVLTLKP